VSRPERQLDEAVRLAKHVTFCKIGDVLYARVPSRSQPGCLYLLPIDEERWVATGFCQCIAAMRFGRDCRHKLAVDLRLEKQREAAFRYQLLVRQYEEARKLVKK